MNLGAIVECNNCKKIFRYNSDEIENEGTFWHPIWVVTCKNCGNKIIEEGEKLNLKIPGEFPDNFQISKRSDGIIEMKKTELKGTGEERANKSDIREYWIQLYVKENYKKLGFSKLEGPFNSGPDFKGIYVGNDLDISREEIDIEVERDFENYIKHGHHENDRFKNCKLLIILNPTQPTDDVIDKLPDYFMQIDIPDFVNWWQPKAKEYSKKSRIKGILLILSNVIKSKFVENCMDKGRDLSTCPECDICAYNEEGYNVPSESESMRYALYFLSTYKYDILSEEFNLNDIDAHELNSFIENLL